MGRPLRAESPAVVATDPEALEARLRQQAALAELSQLALVGSSVDELLDRAVARVAELLDVEYAKVLELLPSGDLVLRAGVGWRPGTVGTVVSGGPGSQAGYTILSSGPVIVADLETETRFHGPPLLSEHRVQSGVSVLIPGRNRPYGVLGAHTARPRTFTQHDIHFVQAVANLIASAIERKQGEEERARLLEETRRSLSLREEFLSLAAHELRTPLTTLLLQLQGLSRHVSQQGLGDSVTRRVDSAARQVMRLSQLVESLLEVCRLGEGRVKLSSEKVDLAELVEEVVERFEQTGRAQGTVLALDVQSRPVGWWDRLRLEQVVTNLLSNAVKYGAGRPVEVQVRSTDHRAVLSIRDRGIGIPPGDLERIFGRFERAVSPRAYGGLGLGLYVAREIVEAHGGRIHAECATGEGATFVIELPLAWRPEGP